MSDLDDGVRWDRHSQHRRVSETGDFGLFAWMFHYRVIQRNERNVSGEAMVDGNELRD